MVYNPLTITVPHEPQSFAYPEIDEDLNLVWDHLDGSIIGPIHASGASVHQFDESRGQHVKIAGVSDVRIDCYLTESRLAMICHKYDKGGGWVGGGASVLLNAGSKIMAANRRRGKALTGHLRFPWIQHIMFAPKQGFLSHEQLRLAFISEGSQMNLEIIFDKSTDSGAIAFELMKRLVAYRQADSASWSPEEREAFRDLLTAGQVPPPPKGSLAKYAIPTSWPAGAGAQVAPPTAPSELKESDGAELLKDAGENSQPETEGAEIQPEHPRHGH